MSFANSVFFTPTAGGTTDWTVSAAVQGFMTPALAGMVNGNTYRYRAESLDQSQWEIGSGVYNSGTGVLTRAAVNFNSAGTGTNAGQTGVGSKINFSSVPSVGIIASAEDLFVLFTNIVVRKFTATGTYTPSANMLFCIIEGVGGGGGGGGATDASSTNAFAGAGGAGGSYSRLYASAATIGASKAVTIGAGGAGGVASAAGGAGGTTSVGALLTAPGGGGGMFASITQQPNPGVPGGAGTGDISFPGQPGGFGAYSSASGNIFFGSGMGGSSNFGAGGVQVISSASANNGNPGYAFGGGGSGASTAAISASATGGAGAAGVVIVTEFCGPT